MMRYNAVSSVLILYTRWEVALVDPFGLIKSLPADKEVMR